MNVFIIKLPRGYHHNNFTLTVIEKSDRAEIAKITADVQRQNDDLAKAVEQTTPSTGKPT